MKLAGGVIRLYLPQHDEWIPGQPNTDQRFLKAGAETSDGR
jgi:hypothetical protein